MNEEPRNLTKAQAGVWLAEHYRASKKPFTVRAIHAWMRTKGLPYFKAGGNISIPVAALKDWADRNFKRGLHF